MAQADYVVDNGEGLVVRTDINTQLLAIVTQNSGPGAPPQTYPGMLWLDLSAGGDGVLRMRNQANDAWLAYFIDGTDYAAVKAQVTQNTADIADLKGRTSTLETKVADNTAAIAGNSAAIGNMQGDVTALGNRVTAVEGVNVSQDNALSALDARVGAVETKNTAQDTAIAGKIGEAPNDGKQYARQSQAWAAVVSGFPDAPVDGKIYGRKDATWTEVTAAGGSGGGYNPGDLVMTVGNVAPPGTLKANGAIVSRTTYKDLFAVIGTAYGAGDGSTTFALPDWRGEFFRAYDDGRGVDAGRTLNSFENQGIAAHVHAISTQPDGSAGQTVSGNQGTAFNNAGVLQYLGNDATGKYPLWAANSNNAYQTFANETRPRNFALLACIAYQKGAGSGGGGAKIWTADTPPSDPTAYPLWFNTSTLTLFVYYNDGNTNQWVDTAAPDASTTGAPTLDNRWCNSGCTMATRASAPVTAGQTVYTQPDLYMCSQSAGAAVIVPARVERTMGSGRKIMTATQTVTTSNGNLAAADNASGFSQLIEASRIRDFVGQPFTIGFKFFTNVAGQYTVDARERGVARSCVMTFNAVAGENDIQVTFPALPLDFNIPADNGVGLILGIGSIAGANYTTSTTGQWLAGNIVMAAGSVNWLASVNAFIAVGEVFLVPGSGKFRYSQVLPETDRRLVQRYLNTTYSAADYPSKPNAGGGIHRTVQADEPYAKLCEWCYPVTMRAGPNVVTYSPVTGANGKCSTGSGDVDASVVSQNEHHASVRINSGTVAQGDYFVHLLVSAELF